MHFNMLFRSFLLSVSPLSLLSDLNISREKLLNFIDVEGKHVNSRLSTHSLIDSSPFFRYYVSALMAVLFVLQQLELPRGRSGSFRPHSNPLFLLLLLLKTPQRICSHLLLELAPLLGKL